MSFWWQDVRTYAGSRPLLPGDDPNVGHVQRIFALKYHPDDNNIFISGGWDNALKVILIILHHPLVNCAHILYNVIQLFTFYTLMLHFNFLALCCVLSQYVGLRLCRGLRHITQIFSCFWSSVEMWCFDTYWHKWWMRWSMVLAFYLLFLYNVISTYVISFSL